VLRRFVLCCVVLCCVVLCRVIEAASLPILSLLFFQLRDNYCQTLQTCTVAFCPPKKWTGSDANIKPRHNFFSSQYNFLFIFCSNFSFSLLIRKEALSVFHCQNSEVDHNSELLIELLSDPNKQYIMKFFPTLGFFFFRVYF
jgi:hypothetical protein